MVTDAAVASHTVQGAHIPLSWHRQWRPSSSFLPLGSLLAAADGSSVPATNMGDPDWVPGSWLWPDPVPAGVGTERVRQQMRAYMSVNLCSLPLKQINKNNKQKTFTKMSC